MDDKKTLVLQSSTQDVSVKLMMLVVVVFPTPNPDHPELERQQVTSI